MDPSTPRKPHMSSMDDITLGTKPLIKVERRARSSSPSKTRRPVSASIHDVKTSPISYASLDDLRSLVSATSSLEAKKQLKALSRSPISKKLHINASLDPKKYIIPIPFTLQLPPKLSANNSASSLGASSPKSPNGKYSSRPPKLVYTGSGYEMLDQLSASELEEEDDISVQSPTRRSKPPPVAINKRNLKKNRNMKLDQIPDELSIIEEASVCGSSLKSRNPSITSSYYKVTKPLPPPKPITFPKPQTGPKLNSSFSTSNLPREKTRNIEDIEVSEASRGRDRPMAVSGTNNIESKIDSKASGLTTIPRTFTDYDIQSLRQTNAPISQINGVLKVHKRSFSDESYASSASDLSHITGISNITTNRGALMSTIMEEEGDMNSSNVPLSRIFTSNTSSSGTLEDSLISEDESTETPEDEDSFEEDSQTLSEKPVKELPAVPTSSQDNAAIKYFNFQDIKPGFNQNTEIMEPRKQLSAPACESDNEGPGKLFLFPNNDSNITNNEQLKKKALEMKMAESPSKLNLFQNNREEIEIPNLDDMSTYYTGSTGVSDTMSCVNGENYRFQDMSSMTTNDSALEPIGVPSKDAKMVGKEQFKMIYNDDSDTDIDIDLAERTPSSNAKAANLSKEKELPPIPQPAQEKPPSATGSFRAHRRSNSMFHIDFSPKEEAEKGPTPSRSHRRTKSIGSHISLSGVPSNLPQQTRKSQNEPLEKMGDSIASDFDKLQIAEPPKRVNYDVDFKEADSQDDFGNDFGLNQKIIQEIYGHVRGSKQDEKVITGGSLKVKEKTPMIIPRSKTTGYERSHKLKLTDYSLLTSTGSLWSRNGKFSNCTPDTDAESITIDLTTDKYDVCMIKRKDSVLSYRSVTEKTKDGKEVEVVLVDDDMRDGPKYRDEFEDELESIYSKYKKDKWVFRTNSTVSNSSESSIASYESDANSETQLRIKPRKPNPVKSKLPVVEENVANKTIAADAKTRTKFSSEMNLSKLKQGYGLMDQARVMSNPTLLSQKRQIQDANQNYFDYSSNGNYDFKSFMMQQSIVNKNQY